MSRVLVVSLTVTSLLAAGTASAERPHLTLPKGSVQVAANLEINMSADAVAKPLSLAPDVGYGLSDDLTLALVHSRYAITGLRANAGGGLCLSGSDGGCVAVYNNVGAEAAYDLGQEGLGLAAVAGFHALNLDAGLHALKIGVRVRYPAGKLAINAAPSLLIAVTKREDDAGNRLNKDTLWVPVQATYKATPEVTVGVGTGLKGPLSGFGDAWQVPLGFMVQYAFDKQLGVGASWVFGQLVGGAAPAPAPDPTGTELRGPQLWATYTFAP